MVVIHLLRTDFARSGGSPPQRLLLKPLVYFCRSALQLCTLQTSHQQQSKGFAARFIIHAGILELLLRRLVFAKSGRVLVIGMVLRVFELELLCALVVNLAFILIEVPPAVSGDAAYLAMIALDAAGLLLLCPKVRPED
jgi:hypothetical protein